MASGEFKIGTVTTDNNQLKVHKTQLNSFHIQNLKNTLKQTTLRCDLRFSDHYFSKTEVGSVSDEMDMIRSTINAFLEGDDNILVEYNEKDGSSDRRILLRSTLSREVDIKDEGYVLCNYCFVINIDNANIVTAYWNAVSDVHNQINMNNYVSPSAVLGLKKITHTIR